MPYKYRHDTDTIRICVKCIGDHFLREEVRAEGQQAPCSYCTRPDAGITLGDLADRVHEVIEAQFYLTASQPTGSDYALAKEGRWERPGELVADVIADVAGLDEAAAEDVRACLSDVHGYSAVKDGGDDPYASDAQYEERGPDDLNFRDTWESFCQQVRWRNRFFSKYAEGDLTNIFGDLTTLRTRKGESVIREISTSGEDRFVFRARVAFSHAELEDILRYPARELGAPPSRLARAGRMNAAGISVFYGAVDMDTCVAELRAPVGSSVVVGCFEIIRQVRLIDMDALAEVYVEGSHFDPKFSVMRGRAAFLNHLVQMISRPVMPNDEIFEYLPTQVISEYLATKAQPSVDGLMFRSSQTGGVGRNLVLFNHASAAEPDDVPPGTEISFLMGSGPDDDFDSTIAVFETIPTVEPPKIDDSEKRPNFAMAALDVAATPIQDNDAAWLSDRELTLHLSNESVRVLRVSAVSYTCTTRNVMRIRRTRSDKEPF